MKRLLVCTLRGVFLTLTSLASTVTSSRAQEAVQHPAGADTIRDRHTRAPVVLDPLLVRGERNFAAVSSRTIRALDINLRPRSSSQELLRLAPGIVVVQHAGGGKAEQIFLRGFDADHGTDVAISVDGIPVNMVSHAHGQGYADLHFLIPEVVERIEVNKGPYVPSDGDFATAGSVHLRTLDRLPAAVARLRGGSFRTANGLVMLPFGAGITGSGGYVAGSLDTSNGPFEASQDFRRHNFFGKWTRPWRRATLVGTLSGFASDWDASGQIPERAVRSRRLTRFGAIDASEGGETHRYDASFSLRSAEGQPEFWEARAYLARYYLDLFSNFTFFLSDPANGDGIEQRDDRYLGGLQVQYRRPASLAGSTGSFTIGAGGRADVASVLLARQRERERLDPLSDDAIRQVHGYMWTRYDTKILPRVRVQLGVRADAFRFSLRDRLLDGENESPFRSGKERQAIVSPKASLAFDLSDATTLFANAATGFHSNHARDAVLAEARDRVLPRAVGAELGIRHTWTRGSVAASLWLLDLQSELVYVGDEGTTEPNGRSARRGIDLEARARLLPWLWMDGDLNLSRGRLVDEPPGEDLIPLAPRVTSSAGLTSRDLGRASGGARIRHVGSRPANETNSVVARGYTVAEIFARYSFGDRLDVFGTIDNLLNVEWNEAQFATTSRLPGEPAAGITELHFTPGHPRSAQLGVELRF